MFLIDQSNWITLQNFCLFSTIDKLNHNTNSLNFVCKEPSFGTLGLSSWLVFKEATNRVNPDNYRYWIGYHCLVIHYLLIVILAILEIKASIGFQTEISCVLLTKMKDFNLSTTTRWVVIGYATLMLSIANC